MTNPTNENKNANVGKPRFQLTTKSLGIAEAKAQDLAGYVLNQKDIVNVKAIKKGTQCDSFTFETQNMKYEYNIQNKQIKII